MAEERPEVTAEERKALKDFTFWVHRVDRSAPIKQTLLAVVKLAERGAQQ